MMLVILTESAIIGLTIGIRNNDKRFDGQCVHSDSGAIK